ncbi:DNA topoisomerase, partial [Lactarius deliciosus]
RSTRSNFIKNYDFEYPQCRANFTFTLRCRPRSPDKQAIVDNLTAEARRAQQLRRRDIGAEIAKICRKSRPNIVVKRARFSAIIAQQIHNAAQHPCLRVEARIVLDLRIGAAFTRLQTHTLQNRIQQINSVFLPTMKHRFTWRRGHLFNFTVAYAIYEGVLEDNLARVTKVTKKNTKKWYERPHIAEHLYQQGFLSYPRTETDQYDPQFDFMSLIAKQVVDPGWGGFASNLQDRGGFTQPRRGKNNDQAHPPIHPTAHAGNLAGDEKRVYEFITRRFLACCSKDALGFETVVDVVYGGEEFFAKVRRLIILERNYLDVYPYDKWQGKELPDFEEGATFVPSVCELRDGTTTKPTLLTEADLVGIMDKNGIGTDATIAQHIDTIINREYVIPRMEGAVKYLVPSTLGIGLVNGYNDIGFDRSLSKPQLRRETERNMIAVCQGTKSKNDMIVEAVEQYKDMFVRARANFAKVTSSVRRHIEGDGRPGGGGNNGNGGPPPGGNNGNGGPPQGRNNGNGGPPHGRNNGNGGPPHGGNDGNSGPPPGRNDGDGKRGRDSTRNTRNAGAPKRSSTSTRPRRTAPTPVAGPDPDSDDEALWGAVPPLPVDLAPAPGPNPSRPPSRPPPSSRAAPQTAPRSAPATGPSASAPQINCFCGKPSVELTVRKESANKGRQFRRCGQPENCDFFEWTDEPPRDAGTKPSSRPPNPPSIPAKRSRTDDAAPRRYCQCDLTAVLKIVKKEGSNQGRHYWSCPNSQAASCNFFEWEDDPAAAVTAAPLNARTMSAGAGSQQTTGECYNCGQPGHWASGMSGRHNLGSTF